MNKVSNGGARHGPIQVEDHTQPVAVPRSWVSNHSDNALAAEGNTGASPMPNNTLSPTR